jgi:hypothetical protein
VLRQPDEHVSGIGRPSSLSAPSSASSAFSAARRADSSCSAMTSSTLLPARPARYVSDSRAALRALDHRDGARARGARERALRASFATVLGVPEGDADRLREPMTLPALGCHRDRTRPPGQQPRSVAPASTRPRAPRRLEPTTSRPARHSSAASCSVFAALVPARTLTRASTTPRRTGARSFVRESYPTRIGCPKTRDVGRGAPRTRERCRRPRPSYPRSHDPAPHRTGPREGAGGHLAG